MDKSPEQVQTEKLFKKICRKAGTTMRDLDQRMLEAYAALNNLVKVEKSCLHEESSQRDKIFDEYLPGSHS